jgi:hypothetical protein
MHYVLMECFVQFGVRIYVVLVAPQLAVSKLGGKYCIIPWMPAVEPYFILLGLLTRSVRFCRISVEV